MKLTPEQKAFFEYGKAVETLETRIERIRNNARIRFKMEYHELPLRFRGGLWDDFQLYNVIGDVRRKRAACRAWVPLEKRECRTCSYLEEDDGSEICENCMIFNSLASSCNWEPRKEGE